MIEQDPYAESTVAMSVYNYVALKGHPCSMVDIFEELKTVHLTSLTEDLFCRSCEALIDTPFVAEINESLFVKDPKRRYVVNRDRSDFVSCEETGRITGGWNKWMIKDLQRGLIPIEEVEQ